MVYILRRSSTVVLIAIKLPIYYTIIQMFKLWVFLVSCLFCPLFYTYFIYVPGNTNITYYIDSTSEAHSYPNRYYRCRGARRTPSRWTNTFRGSPTALSQRFMARCLHKFEKVSSFKIFHIYNNIYFLPTPTVGRSWTMRSRVVKWVMLADDFGIGLNAHQAITHVCCTNIRVAKVAKIR